MTFRLINADCLDAMAAMPENSIDSIVCDPPYNLAFMGKIWDRNLNHGPWATEALRILKPGGHLLAFGGTRTYHRLACAIEDAGFEIRDCLAWLYGSGFPKSLDVSKAIDKAAGAEREVVGLDPESGRRNKATPRFNGTDYANGEEWQGAAAVPLTAPATPEAQRWAGYGTSLKPAFEPVVMARKPLSEKNVAANVLRWGTGALNIDGTRIELGEGDDATKMLPDQHGDQPGSFYQQGGRHGATLELKPNGRWPANVVLGHSPDCREVGTRTIAGKAGGSGTAPLQTVGADNSRPFHADNEARPKTQAADVEVTAWECAPGCAVAMLDEQTGEVGAAAPVKGTEPMAPAFSGNLYGEASATSEGHPFYADTGGASRFFYVAKADREERNRGVEHLNPKALNWSSGEQSPGTFQAEGTNRTAANNHPTVKPVELMRWLCRMVTPKGGTVLDPFTGSGSTGVAAMREGFEFIGIEREAEYVEIARGRIYGDAPMFNIEVEA